MYSDTYINQFGDDIIHPDFEPISQNSDPRIDDGCYYSGGVAVGEAPCVPLTGTTTEDRIIEANRLIEQEARALALESLADEPSREESLNADDTVKVGQVVMFVKSGYRWVNNSEMEALGALVGSTTVTNLGADKSETMFDRLVTLANDFVDGVLSILEIHVDRVEISNELCVDDVCLNADDLRALLDSQRAASGGSQPTSEPEPTPPQIVPEPPLEDIGGSGQTDVAPIGDNSSEGGVAAAGETGEEETPAEPSIITPPPEAPAEPPPPVGETITPP